MSGEAVRKAWVVAASIGSVEALKDQGVARWNGPLVELHQHAKTRLLCTYGNITADRSSRSLFTGVKYDRFSSGAAGGCRVKTERNEDSMNKVMDVNCFGPNTIRF